MSAPGPQEELERAREDVTERDARISEMQRVLRRLEHLYEISKLLVRFENFGRTVPEVVSLVARTLPLRSAIFILETAGAPRTITWHAEGETAEMLRVARARAQEAYSYLVRSGVELERAESTILELPHVLTATPAVIEGRKTFVILPLVVRYGTVFGALQIEGAHTLVEPDLYFINAVVNQLAIALDREATNRAVRTSEEKLAGIVALAADAIISTDETQHITMYNPGAERIFGWSRKEALGRSLDVLVPERGRKAHRQYVAEFAKGRETTRDMGSSSAMPWLRKSGEEFPAEATISKQKVGGASLFTVILRDISEQRRIEHEGRFLTELGVVLATTLDFSETLATIARLSLQEFADFCVIDFADEHGEIRRLEVAAADPANANLAATLKQLPLDRSRPHLTFAILQSSQPMLISETNVQALRELTQSEEELQVLNAMAPVSMMGVPLIIRGRLVGAFVVLSCRPGRRYGALDLRLLQEVGRRAALALENAGLYRGTQRALQARDDVLGVVAHDLRNPLGAILMRVERLRRLSAEPERSSRDAVEAIHRAATRMDLIIEDLLDVACMDAGKLSIRLTDVSAEQVIRDAVEAQAPLLASRSLELQLELSPELPTIWADRDRILQVFENLIGNAVKFTPAFGRITVGARLREDGVLFWIADTGEGIPLDDLPHLFERFWQPRKGDRRGAGLGLPIVKGIVEAHGGQIWVESTPGLGSTFYFTVPVRSPA